MSTTTFLTPGFGKALFSPSQMCAINITISNDPRQRLGSVLHVTDDR